MKQPKKPIEPQKPVAQTSFINTMKHYGRSYQVGLDELESFTKQRKLILSEHLENERFVDLYQEVRHVRILAEYRKKLRDYRQKQLQWPDIWKQYLINFKIWQAWELKRLEDKLLNELNSLDGKKLNLEKELARIASRKQEMIDESEG